MLDSVLFLFLGLDKQFLNCFGRLGWPLEGPVLV